MTVTLKIQEVQEVTIFPDKYTNVGIASANLTRQSRQNIIAVAAILTLPLKEECPATPETT